MEAKVEFDQSKAEEYDNHPLVKPFQPVFQKLLSSWEWYNKPPLTVLDFGCGTGLNSFEFANGGHTVTAADVSPHMLDVLKKKLESSPHKEKISLVQVGLPGEDDWLKALPVEHFDVIFVIAVLHHVATDQQQQVIASLSKLLKAGGRICVVEFEDTEQSRAARGSFHHHKKHDDHDQHQDSKQQGHEHDHSHHHEHQHHHDHHQGTEKSDKHEAAHYGHEHHWLDRSVLTTYYQQSGLTVSESELFAINFDNGHTLDCFYMIGSRNS